jgi:hypothetical protein
MPDIGNAPRPSAVEAPWQPAVNAPRRRPIGALRPPAIAVMAAVALATIGLAACGGSSGSSSSQANAAATNTTTSATGTTTSTPTTSTTPSTSTSPTPGKGAGGTNGAQRDQRFQAIRECLQKNGITPPGNPPGAGGRFLRVGPRGTPRAKFDAALKKCGIHRGPLVSPGAPATTNPHFRQSLGKFAECLRKNGVNIPAPNTSGNGPIFSTKGINTNSPQFRSATLKCRYTLMGAFRGLGVRRPPTGSPPAG